MKTIENWMKTMHKLKKTIEKLKKTIEKWKKTMEQSKKTIEQVKKTMEKLKKPIGKLKKTMGKPMKTMENSIKTIEKNPETSGQIDEQCEWEILATKCSKWGILAAKTKEGRLDDQKKMQGEQGERSIEISAIVLCKSHVKQQGVPAIYRDTHWSWLSLAPLFEPVFKKGSQPTVFLSFAGIP